MENRLDILDSQPNYPDENDISRQIMEWIRCLFGLNRSTNRNLFEIHHCQYSDQESFDNVH